jgi:hypothetical protein
VGAKLEPDKYGALRSISGILVFVGWLLLVAGLIGAVFGLLEMTSVQQTYGPGSVNLAFGFSKMIAGITALVTGVLVIAMGQVIRLFVDIALQTAPIALIAENSSKTVAFFERVNSRVSPGSPIGADKPATNAAQAQARAKEVINQGVDICDRKWRQYDDGSIDLQTSKGLKTFSSHSEYSKYSLLEPD